jgi:hypothetical protein
MATATKPKPAPKIKKSATSKKQPAKKKISKFGQMRGSYKGKIIEIGNVWDL